MWNGHWIRISINNSKIGTKDGSVDMDNHHKTWQSEFKLQDPRGKKKVPQAVWKEVVACKVLHPILQILERGRSELFQLNIYKSNYAMEYTLNYCNISCSFNAMPIFSLLIRKEYNKNKSFWGFVRGKGSYVIFSKYNGNKHRFFVHNPWFKGHPSKQRNKHVLNILCSEQCQLRMLYFI